jgi:hypothetical protein
MPRVHTTSTSSETFGEVSSGALSFAPALENGAVTCWAAKVMGKITGDPSAGMVDRGAI